MKHNFNVNTSSGSFEDGLFIKSQSQSLYNVILMAHLVHKLKYMFSVFKQYYMYFHTSFHPHVFPKKLKTVI